MLLLLLSSTDVAAAADLPPGLARLGPLVASAALVFLPQVIVWVAWAAAARERLHLAREEEGEVGILLLPPPSSSPSSFSSSFSSSQVAALVQEGLGVSRMPVGSEEPPPAYSEVVGELLPPSPLGPPPPYTALEQEKEGGVA